MNVSEQLSAQIMDQVGPAWQSHSRIRMSRRRLSWSANRVSCSVTSLACGPWLLGPICQWLWGWAQLLGIRWGLHWCFPPKAEALFPTTCGTQRHHRMGRGAHWPAVRLIVVVLLFIMKTLNLYRFLNSCPNQLLFFCVFHGKCSHSKWIQFHRV